ncbi:unnamed protein product [Boreogadus saida]
MYSMEMVERRRDSAASAQCVAPPVAEVSADNRRTVALLGGLKLDRRPAGVPQSPCHPARQTELLSAPPPPPGSPAGDMRRKEKRLLQIVGLLVAALLFVPNVGLWSLYKDRVFDSTDPVEGPAGVPQIQLNRSCFD